ncbi:MAG: hypothetical protein ACI4UK_02425, partial [Floccifex sp.]
RIEIALRCIIKETKERKINWRPFSEFWNANQNNENLSEFICSLQNEFTEIIFSDSFFAKKEEKIIFLITSKWESGKDGSISEHKDIMISASAYGDILNVPDYAYNYKNDLFEKVKEYWQNKCEDYNQDISDILDVLDTFSGDSEFEKNKKMGTR